MSFRISPGTPSQIRQTPVRMAGTFPELHDFTRAPGNLTVLQHTILDTIADLLLLHRAHARRNTAEKRTKTFPPYIELSQIYDALDANKGWGKWFKRREISKALWDLEDKKLIQFMGRPFGEAKKTLAAKHVSGIPERGVLLIPTPEGLRTNERVAVDEVMLTVEEKAHLVKGGTDAELLEYNPPSNP